MMKKVKYIIYVTLYIYIYIIIYICIYFGANYASASVASIETSD